ncbi:hypothetical protein [Antarcticirhabdus aurantiaca]|uniref:Uncharacterized protein n=1 Tax=Antarcticirhabdus aurantiaca TaxID=2606717 RepID=A0ACD4NM06_9HYPH|nr:hypothetical protein OXU80_24055 [Jeongeuplla avenae]
MARSFAEEEIPDRLLRKSVELMLSRGVAVEEITTKLLEWAVIAAREADEPEFWKIAFARTGEMVAE